MPIKYKVDLDWYQPLYLVTDLEQVPWILIGINLTPNGPMFSLTNNGEVIDVYDGEFSIDVNHKLKLGLENKLD